jgi:outer membrane lipoprotein-sorting protein
MFQACRDLNPCAFGEAVQKAASKEALGEERLASGETVKAYKLSLDEARASAPIPGLQAAMPQPKYLKVWMAGDNLPRKVEAYDAKDKVFIFTSFENVESAEGAPDSAFAVVPPKDVLRIEMTEVVLELIEAQEKAGKKPAR